MKRLLRRRRELVLEALESRTLFASALTYTGSANADFYDLRIKAGSPTQIEVRLNSTVIDTQTLSNVTSITFNTGANTDTLTLTFDNGNPIPAGGVIFDGGAGISDQLNAYSTAAAQTVSIVDAANPPPTAGWVGFVGNSVERVNVFGSPTNDLVSIGAGIQTFATVTGNAGNDTLTVSSAAATFTFNGGTTATDHDVLTMNAGTYALTADANTTTAHLSLNVNGGSVSTTTSQHLESLKIGPAGSVSMSAGGTNCLFTDNLSISPGGKLDLNDNKLVVTYTGPSPFARLQGYSFNGYADAPDSTRTGIISTASQNSAGSTILVMVDNALASFNEWPINSGNTIGSQTIIGKSVFFGDFDLTGAVTPDDYGAIDSNLGTNPPVGLSWTSGDADFNGAVTPDDYLAVDSNLGRRDTTGPAVSITSLVNTQTLSSTATLTASAADLNDVATVQFFLDNRAVGTADTTYPFSVAWATTGAANGTYQLTARATDSLGNTTTSAPVTVNISNTGTAAVGQWSSVITFPIVAMNAVLLKNGKVLMWDGGPDCIGGTTGKVWDPTTGAFTAAPSETQADYRDIFCSAQTALADGRVLVVGGHECVLGGFTGQNISNLFDPVTNTWTDGPNMAYRRWYPSVITMGNGKALVVAGSVNGVTDYVPIPEVYDPITNKFTTLNSANQTIPNYPFIFNLPDGRVLVAGSDEAKMASYVLNVNTQQWSVVDPTVLDAGSAVMYEPGKVLKAGSSYLSPPADNGGNIPSSSKSYVIDMTQPSATWQQTGSMAYPRTHLNLTVLPDGSVLSTGGSSTIGGISASEGVLPAELWNPNTKTWSTMSSMARSRVYHSTGLLLPDGRVLVAGSGHNYANNYAELSGEIYSPPYLFRGARPTISSSPTLATYGSGFFVGTPDASKIASVSLVRNGSVTHAFNMDQRRVPLNFAVTNGGLTVQAPADSNIAPPGYYMLFIVDKNGVPSVAPMVRLPSPTEDVQPPTAPTNLGATGSVGKTTLSWSAASDDFAVDHYNVHRSTTSGFAPAAGNLIGTSTTTGYVDQTIAGTYYYKVVAVDSNNNSGPASNQASATVTADTSAPSVSVTAPAAGSTVSNVVTLNASATDNVGVAGVQFKVDGQIVGAEDTTAPFSVAWTSNLVANGSHTITAVARDFAGNTTTSAPITITVSNTAPTNLVASYSFDENAGAIAVDGSGHGLNGTITGAQYAAGKYSTGLLFNGTSDWVSINHNALLNLTTAMTLEAWVYPTQAGGYRSVMLKQRTNGLAYALYAFDGDSRPPAGYINKSSTDYSAAGLTILPLNAWSHLAATYDGSNVRMYVNGTLAGTTAVTGSITTSTDVLRIGGNSIWGEYFKGMIDEVRIYSRALSATEIASDMNVPIGS
jgi:hypothetical protein